MKTNGIDKSAKPSGDGCLECLAGDGWWLHLRRCAACGHIGCCDNSPHQHASRHARECKHPVVTSFEPGEEWFYNYDTGEMFAGPTLLPPVAHPLSQPVPGPSGKVPHNWRSQLH